jgi:thiamine-phosphate diphosphorylase
MEDLGVRAAAIAAGGASVALHVRDHAASGSHLAAVAGRFLSLARPPEAAVLVNGHPEIARALGAQGVQLATGDLSPEDARAVFSTGWIGSSVHSEREAELAAREGADFLLVGPIFATPSHPTQVGAGLELIRSCATYGLPVIAIGGISRDRVPQVRDAGAYGVAAISALWKAGDPAVATLAMLEPWTNAP